MANEFTLNVPQSNVAPYLASVGQSLAGGLERLQMVQAQQQMIAEQRRQAEIESKRQRQAQMQFQQDFEWYKANPSKENYAKFLGRNMWASKAIESIYGAMEEGQRKAELDWLQPVRAALQTKNPEVAKDLMMQRYTALGESGKYPEQRKFLDNLLNMVTQGGEQGANTALATLIPREAALLNANNPQDVMAKLPEVPFATAKAESGARIEAEKAEQEKMATKKWMDKYQRALGVDEKTANAAWLNAVTNAKKQDQDVREYADKLLQNISSTMEDAPVKFADLNANVQQEILKSSNEATESEQEANRFKALADQYESENIEGYGVFTDFNEWMKQSLGLEDTDSLRRMQIKIAGSMAALEALTGKGPVSDFELRTFMNGVPKKGASKELVVAYLKGRSKAAQLVSSMANAKQLFLAQNSGSPVAERNFLIYGIPVEQGDTLADFQRNYGNALLEQMFPGDQPEMSYAE